MPANQAHSIAFIDVEASGLGARSWPIEAGWAFSAGEATSYLIRPDPAWAAEAWDPRAEALHEISKQELERDGRAPEAVCGDLNAGLRGVEVYSDAPDWDGFWLHRLFSTVGLKQEFAVLDFATMIRAFAGDDWERFVERANHIAPRRHRAGADVMHLQAIHRLAVAAATN
jgi:hypothetical protein